MLCAYLHMPADEEQKQYLQQHQVRHTVIRVIRDHLRIPRSEPTSWQGYDFDFTGAVFSDGSVNLSKTSGLNVEVPANVPWKDAPPAGLLLPPHTPTGEPIPLTAPEPE